MSDETQGNETPKNEGGEGTTPQGESNEGGDELAKAKEVAENYKIRSEKAEKENKELKAKLESETPKKQGETETPKNEEQPSEPDSNDRLDKLTLKTEGVTHPDDQKVVLDEAKRLKLSVEEVLGFEHIQAKLKGAKTQREAEGGMPEGSGKGYSGGSKGTVDYWLDKKGKDGGYENPKDPKLALEVINARMERDRRKLEFPDS